MSLKGPILLIEDDPNDAEVITAAISDIGIPNPVKIMPTTKEAYDYLSTTQERPFVIICDIRMPVTDGLAFRRSIQENDYLRHKSIPFLFLTGMVSQEIINSAYDLDVQGFFQKASSYEGLKDQLLAICVYWKQCLHPNS